MQSDLNCSNLLLLSPPAFPAPRPRQTPTNAHSIGYDMRNPFVLCGQSLTAIYKGAKFEQCPYCKTYYQPDHKNTTCAVCGIAKVGIQAAGMFAENKF